MPLATKVGDCDRPGLGPGLLTAFERGAKALVASAPARVTVPADLAGLAMRLDGCSARGKPKTVVVAFGDVGKANFDSFRRRYLRWRRARDKNGSDPRTDQLTVRAVFRDDIDSDGNAELLGYLDREWKPIELGILWTSGGSPARLENIGATQESAYRLLVVPPSLNGGEPLIVAVNGCCGATAFRSFAIRDRTVAVVAHGVSEGRYPVNLSPSRSGAAKVSVGTSRGE